MNRIYLLLDPRTSEVRYVGVTMFSVEFRRHAHITRSRSGERGYKCDWIRSLLRDGVEPEAVLIEETEDRSREAHWISHYMSLGAKLTNLTMGGDGVPGYCHSDETRIKMSKAWEKRVPISPETRQRLSAAHLGRALSPEHRAKIGSAHKGKPETKEAVAATRLGRHHTEETKRRISEKKKGRKLSPEHCNKLRVAKKGHTVSDETREKLRKAQTGKKASVEARKKMSKARREYLEKTNGVRSDDLSG